MSGVAVRTLGGKRIQRTTEAISQGLDRENSELAGSELDRQREPVESPDHLDHGTCIHVGQLESRATPGMLDKGTHARLSGELDSGRSLMRQRQRLQADDVLTWDVESHA